MCLCVFPISLKRWECSKYSIPTTPANRFKYNSYLGGGGSKTQGGVKHCPSILALTRVGCGCSICRHQNMMMQVIVVVVVHNSGTWMGYVCIACFKILCEALCTCVGETIMLRS